MSLWCCDNGWCRGGGRDEELLRQGLELNDRLQSVLAKHDAIASGSSLPTQATNFNPGSAVEPSLKPADVKEPSRKPDASPSLPLLIEL